MKKEPITILKGLHEHTTYEVRGREVNRTTWMPLRGMREGCATSPGPFNVYHATSIRIATETRQERARQPIGAPWQWSRGNSFPPKDTKKASGNSSATRVLRLTVVLFADDTTLIGKKTKIENGKQTAMEILGRFEKICQPDKEENLALGTANGIRILGSYADRKIDLTMRLQRMRRAAFVVKKRIKKTRLTKRQQGIVAQTCVESTALFDAAVRPWYKSEINKLQREIDR